MKLDDICSYLDSAVPLSFQEDYDNSGLQFGLPESIISSALLSVDVTEDVIDEAKRKKCDLIISHHPVIFNGIKKLTGRSFTEKVILKALAQGISVYSAHTNLDISGNGVSMKMAEKLNLQKVNVLSPLKKRLLKLVTYIPESYFEKVRDALWKAGAGVTGNYDQCGFVSSGTGSFRGNEKSKPFVGEKLKVHFEKEVRFETILFDYLKKKVTDALLEAHPYEEVAYDIYSLENDNVEIGLGCVGELSEEMNEKDFLSLVSSVFYSRGLRFSNPVGRPVRKVALCGGSGASLINCAIASEADAFITADIKYHNYFDTDNKILLVDAGHF
ncbi:MAG TPA: Nif3-like dinuclear metal center hexameric protein, partial [Bacteroidales bacterium]|nr:Nif3-like dinuclear metal center hexameric protein [Bacteroidales bacterium]